MKQFILSALCLLTFSGVIAQKYQPGFRTSVRAGLGVIPDDNTVLVGSAGLQGEYKTRKILSFYGNAQYNRLFSFSDGAESIGLTSVTAGPRFYITPGFFTGAGPVWLYFAKDGITASSWAANPHLGFDTGNKQVTLEYTDDFKKGGGSGIFQVAVAFKLGKK